MNGKRNSQNDTRKNLSISLACEDPAWVSLLDSEGLAWEILDMTRLSQSIPEVIVLPYHTPAKIRMLCFDLACRGSSIISEIRQPEMSSSISWESKTLAYHRTDFSGLANENIPDAIQVSWTTYGEGKCYQLPFKLKDLWSSWGTERKKVLVDPDQKTFVFERMAQVVKKNVRRVIWETLRQAFFARQLPLVHKWYWPGRNRSIFCFRGDLDGGPVENLREYLDTVRPFAGCVTLFVCTSLYQNNKEIIKALIETGIEVQSHTHCHFVFHESLTNRRNLEKAEQFLVSVGAKPSGLVAPAYFWHPTLHTLLAHREYQYSSCFGLSHDNLPYCPVVKSKVSPVLEIPFHCLGDLFPKFDIEMDGTVTRKFFSDLIAKKYAAGEPMNLYGHPEMPGRLGSYPNLIRFIYEQAASFPNVWRGQMGQFASWWRQRKEFRFQPYFNQKKQCVICLPPSGQKYNEDYPTISIHTPDGGWYLTESSACLNPGYQINPAGALSPLRLPRPNDVGEVIYSSEESSLRQKLWYYRRQWKRQVTKYREIYLDSLPDNEY